MKEGWGLTFWGMKMHYFVGKRSLCGRKVWGDITKVPGDMSWDYEECLICSKVVKRRREV